MSFEIDMDELILAMSHNSVEWIIWISKQVKF